MHHGQTGGPRRRNRAERHFLVGYAQRSPVWLEGARQNADQRGFSGPVGAEKAMHLACSDLERDVVQGSDAAEPLADAGGFQQRPARSLPHPRKRSSRTRNWATFSFVTISLAR